MERQKVYIETSVISNLTARPASNIADAARQCPTFIEIRIYGLIKM